MVVASALVAVAVASGGCSGEIDADDAITAESANTTSGGAGGGGGGGGATTTGGAVTPGTGTGTGTGTGMGTGTGSGSPAVTAAALLAKLSSCVKASSAPYAKDSGGAANIDVCKLTGAVYWKADLDVDCDGKSSTACNKTTDPSYQSQTATTDSTGQYLDAATLPFVVVPGVSSRWSYKLSGVSMGSVAAVIYDGKIEYGIVGDVGPTSIIGEASYAMAKRLGINPDPKIGGTSSGVTYVVFTGTSGVVTKKEDHAEAVAKGSARAAQLIAEN